jgi:hypothetical protein
MEALAQNAMVVQERSMERLANANRKAAEIMGQSVTRTVAGFIPWPPMKQA